MVIAVVVAALALFGLRIFSNRSDDMQTASLSGAERLGPDGMPLDSSPGGRDGRRGRLGENSGGAGGDHGRLAPGGFGSDRGSGSGGANRGAADTVMGGSRSHGGGVGGSVGGGSAGGGSGGGGSAGSGTLASAGSSGQLGPKTERHGELVESLGSRPATKSDLEAAPKTDDPDGVTLKLDKPEDIADQGGVANDIDKPKDSEDGITIPPDGKVQLPGDAISGDGGSVSFNVKPNWAGSDPGDNALLEYRQEHEWSNRMEIVKNGDFLRFILTDSGGKETDISTKITNWQAGEEHAITASWDGSSKTTYLYVDGQLAGQNQYTAPYVPPTSQSIFFGSDFKSSSYTGADSTFGNVSFSKNPQKP